MRCIALMMEVVSTSETWSFLQIRRRNIAEYSHLHTRQRDNPKPREIFDIISFSPLQHLSETKSNKTGHSWGGGDNLYISLAGLHTGIRQPAVNITSIKQHAVITYRLN
jgi:hypothetical protein